MPNIYNNIYEKYNLNKTSIYIETGCYLGRGIIKPLSNKYRKGWKNLKKAA